MRFKKISAISGFLFLLLSMSCAYYYRMVFMLPSGIHDWAQADRLALAVNFYDNGMNFFKPATFNLMSQDGITGVEFPLQSYLAAIIGKITGREYISLAFRLISTLISCVGLFYLFMAVYKRTYDFIFSLIAPLFIYCSPVFIYYTCNYLPDTASSSFLFVAFYYVLHYLETPRNKYLMLSIFWMLVASLIKTSGALYLIGFAGFVVIHKLRIEKEYRMRSYSPLIGGMICSLAILLLYYYHNTNLNNAYGNSGLFLSTINPFSSGHEILYFFTDRVLHLWLKEYFVLPAYLFFVALYFPAAWYMKRDESGKKYLKLTAIFLLGSMSVLYLMGGQLANHDYYMIVIFFPVLVFAILTGAIILYKYASSSISLKPLHISLVSAFVVMCFFANFQMRQRLKPDYPPFNAGLPWMQDGSKVLEEIGVPKQEKILAFDEDPPNLALLYFDRKGYNIDHLLWNGNLFFAITFMKEKDINIMVCNASKVKKLELTYPYFTKSFHPLYVDTSIAVLALKYDNDTTPVNLNR